MKGIEAYQKGMVLLGSQIPSLEDVPAERYFPNRLFTNWPFFYKRLDCLKATGYLNVILQRTLGNTQDIWQQSYKECREQYPDLKYWRNTVSGKVKEFSFPNTFFPLVYDEKNTTTRLTAKPGNTVSALSKYLKRTVLVNLKQKLGGSFLEIDMVSCHLRFAAGLLGEKRCPLIFNALYNEDFWKTEVEEVMRKYPLLTKGNESTVKEILKVRLLLSINGGNPNSVNNINSFKA